MANYILKESEEKFSVSTDSEQFYLVTALINTVAGLKEEDQPSYRNIQNIIQQIITENLYLDGTVCALVSYGRDRNTNRKTYVVHENTYKKVVSLQKEGIFIFTHPIEISQLQLIEEGKIIRDVASLLAYPVPPKEIKKLTDVGGIDVRVLKNQVCINFQFYYLGSILGMVGRQLDEKGAPKLIRSRFKEPFSPWTSTTTHQIEMLKKTCLKNVLKTLV